MIRIHSLGTSVKEFYKLQLAQENETKKISLPVSFLETTLNFISHSLTSTSLHLELEPNFNLLIQEVKTGGGRFRFKMVYRPLMIQNTNIKQTILCAINKVF